MKWSYVRTTGFANMETKLRLLLIVGSLLLSARARVAPAQSEGDHRPRRIGVSVPDAETSPHASEQQVDAEPIILGLDPSLHVANSATCPRPRWHPAMAFDSIRGKAVLFGGLDTAGSPLADTWEFAGGKWLEQTGADHPSRRFGHVMAFDQAAKAMVLFGGSAGDEVLSDTWLWNGKKWSRFRGECPPPRTGAQLAYDSGRKRIVLFGGTDFDRHVVFGDTWEWDGRRWRRKATEGPPSRFYAAMDYDSVRRQVILFGGNKANDVSSSEKWSAGRLGDTWSWDGNRWHQLSADGPGPRDHHAVSYDKVAGAVILFGGFDGRYLDDTWRFTDHWQRLTTQEAPPARGGRPALFFDDARKRLAIFGGGTGAGAELTPRAFNDLSYLSSSGWEPGAICQ
jgi:hypothetical protein